MHVLVVIYKTGDEYQFFFKDRAKAQKFKNDYSKPANSHSPGDLFLVQDEHGKEGAFIIDQISGCMITDMEGKAETEIAVNLIAERARARLNNMCNADPIIKGIKNLITG